MQNGKVLLVTAFSYLIPLLSTLVCCVYLSVLPGVNLWLGLLLVIAGAIICKYSVIETYYRKSKKGRDLKYGFHFAKTIIKTWWR